MAELIVGPPWLVSDNNRAEEVGSRPCAPWFGPWGAGHRTAARQAGGACIAHKPNLDCAARDGAHRIGTRELAGTGPGMRAARCFGRGRPPGQEPVADAAGRGWDRKDCAARASGR